MMKYHVGVDLHKTIAQVCVRDAKGEIVEDRRRRILDRDQGQALIEYLAPFAAEGQIAVESLGLNRWFVNACRKAGYQVVVAHASALGLKKSGVKTDKRDAREIARRLYLGDLQRHARSYFAPDAEHGRRSLLRLHHRQQDRRKQTVNRIRALLIAEMIRPPHRVLTCKKNLAWLREVKLATEDLTFGLQVLVDDLENLGRQIQALKKRIDSLVSDPEVAMLERQLPGVGAQTAATLRYELGDVRRFDRSRQVAAYAGVVPKVNQSGEGHGHHGRITKRGSRELRWTLTQWAVRLLTHHPEARAWARRQRKGLTRNKLRLALARRLLVGVYMLLSRGEVFSLERCLGRKPA